MAASTVYIPAESAEGSMRPILTAEEAEELIVSMPAIPTLTIQNERFIEQDYKAAMKSNCCKEWVKVIKTIYERKQKRLLAGKKETSLDSRYFKQAEELLYGELAIALKMQRNEMCAYIIKRLQELQTV
jgi:CarD family transcriptional regulator